MPSVTLAMPLAHVTWAHTTNSYSPSQTKYPELMLSLLDRRGLLGQGIVGAENHLHGYLIATVKIISNFGIQFWRTSGPHNIARHLSQFIWFTCVISLSFSPD